MNNSRKAVAIELKKILDRYQYHSLIFMLTDGRSMQEPWTEIPEYRLSKLPQELQKVVRFFYQGKAVELSSDYSQLLSSLENAGLADQLSGTWKLKELRIVPIQGLYLIVDLWSPGNHSDQLQVWLGRDSMFLGQIVQFISKRKRVLDLCTGTGIHALINASAYDAETVEAVDINPRSVFLTEWNALINQLEHKLRVHHGDLFEPFKGKSFDFIIANPPFLPISEDSQNMISFANGGNDGLAVLRRILNECSDYLKKDGVMVIFCGGFGDDYQPSFSRELDLLTKEKGWSTQLYSVSKDPVKFILNNMGSEFPSMQEGITMMLNDISSDITSYYNFLICIRNGTDPVFQAIDCSFSVKERMDQSRRHKKLSQ
ncbi:class I SAM-dependent methyltransferase [Paenibacillus motobuensis]|uniref:Methyltransferase small domain-containing protein n=1 Tax=Paenibacillus motobuensis TaxID=295324 RepID=A0ABN0XXT8_9BACL